MYPSKFLGSTSSRPTSFYFQILISVLRYMKMYVYVTDFIGTQIDLQIF